MKLRYTQPALADLDHILSYIALHSPSGARKVQLRVQAVVNLLLRHPLLGTRTSDPKIRRIAVAPHPYLIFYEVGPDQVIVHAIRHGSRNPSGMPGA